MLIIREQQRQAMRHASLAQTVGQLLRRGFEEDCAVLGQPTIDRGIAIGIARAARHGFHGPDTVGKYLQLMLLLGAFFDEDPLYPWAAAILHDPATDSAAIRMHRLHVTAATFLVRTAGPDGAYYRSALLRLRRTPYEQWFAAPVGSDEASLRRVLDAVYPEHVASLDAATYAALRARVDAAAQAHGMACSEGVLVLASVMVMAGAFFDRDPFHTWATPVLNQPLGPARKARALHQAALNRLDRYRLLRERQGSERR